MIIRLPTGMTILAPDREGVVTVTANVFAVIFTGSKGSVAPFSAVSVNASLYVSWVHNIFSPTSPSY